MKTLIKEELLEEVRAHGIEINTIDDLKHINMNYRELVPILLKFIERIDDEEDKEFLVRCLGAKGFSEATPILLNEFYRTSNTLYKWSIGNSLALINDRNALDDMLSIACEKDHGIARQMIVDALGSFNDPRVVPVLVGLLKDEDVVGHAISALAKTGDASLIERIQPYTNHKVKWIRNEAIKAIKKLSKINRYSNSLCLFL